MKGKRSSRKQKVLKREGDSIKEQILFSDDMDEFLLEEWERSIEVEDEVDEKGETSPADTFSEPWEPAWDTVDGPDERGDLGSGPMEESARPGSPSTPDEREAGGAGSLGRLLLLAALFLVFLAAGYRAGELIHGPHIPPPPSEGEGPSPSSPISSARELEGLYLPVEGGKAMLYISLSLQFKGVDPGPDADTLPVLAEALYQASRGLQIRQLLGYQGMKRLKERFVRILQERFPGVKVASLHFGDYLLLGAEG
jgi:hypothetical protein